MKLSTTENWSLEMTVKLLKTGGLLPIVFNPGVCAAVVVGIVGIRLYMLLEDDEQEVPQKNRGQVPPMLLSDSNVPADDKDEAQLISEAMSRLGKRSAEARLRKKIENLGN